MNKMKKWKNEKMKKMKKWKKWKKWKNEINAKKMRKKEKMKKKRKNWKKWKIKKKWKKKKKTKKMEKNDEKTKKNEKMDSHAKSSTISRVYRCCCNFFRQNHRRFPWFCFGMCLFHEENQQPVLGSNRFSEEKWQFSLDVTQKHTFYRRKSTKTFANVSPSNNNYSFRVI